VATVGILTSLAIWVAGYPAAGPTAAHQESDKGRPPSASPGDVRLVTSDIANFWIAYDKSTPENRAVVLDEEYLKKGSYGLKEFVRSRIKTARDLAATIERHPKFYAAIRPNTLRVSSMEDKIRESFRKLEEVYPDATFPDVYFVIGKMTSGGTDSPRGLLIGVEMHSRTEDTPTDELGSWHRAVLGPPERIPAIVAHELVHYQQKYTIFNVTLLRQVIQEGSADFIGELICGSQINPHLHEYGNPREKELWQEFMKEMNLFKNSNWLYQGDKAKDRPADLGYYIGYKICESYYNHAQDKAKAVKDILTINDFRKFLADSQYQKKFEAVEK
jgi:hypothetical protein